MLASFCEPSESVRARQAKTADEGRSKRWGRYTRKQDTACGQVKLNNFRQWTKQESGS